MASKERTKAKALDQAELSTQKHRIAHTSAVSRTFEIEISHPQRHPGMTTTPNRSSVQPVTTPHLVQGLLRAGVATQPEEEAADPAAGVGAAALAVGTRQVQQELAQRHRADVVIASKTAQQRQQLRPQPAPLHKPAARGTTQTSLAADLTAASSLETVCRRLFTKSHEVPKDHDVKHRT